MSGNTRHISGRLKQTNKKHNKLGHASKRSVDRKLAGGGRVEAKLRRTFTKPGAGTRSKFGDKNRDGSAQRTNRLNRARQIANERRRQMVLKRRLGAGGGGDAAPKVVCIVGLDDDADQMSFRVRSMLLSDANGSSSGVHDSAAAPGFVSTFASTRWKQRFSVITPPTRDTVAVLDAAKVCDVLVVVVKASADGSYTNNVGIDTLCCIRAQGTPAIVGVHSGLGKIAPKQRSAAKKMSSRFFAAELGEDNFKLVDFDGDVCEVGAKISPSAVSQLCRTIAECPGKELTFRKCRSYVVADEARLDGSDLHVTGYVRGSPLWVNSLIHVTGVGTYRLRRIEDAVDPVPQKGGARKNKKKQRDLGNAVGAGDTSGSSSISNNNNNNTNNNKILLEADPSLQEDLDQMAEPNQLMGEQSFISDAELREADSRLSLNNMTGVAGAAAAPSETMSIHQAWIQAAKEGAAMAGEAFSSVMMGDDGDDPVLGALDGRGVPIGQSAKDLMGTTSAELSSSSSSSASASGLGMDLDDVDDDDEDRHKSAAQVRAEAQALRQQRRKEMQDDDVKFPDEVDTPLDMPARVRFAKYRGLKSFRSSPWDPKESLPADYARIFQLANFTLSQKRATKAATAVRETYEKRVLSMMDAQKKRAKAKQQQKKKQRQKKGGNSKEDGNATMEMDADDINDDDVMDEDMLDDDEKLNDLTPAEILAASIMPGRFVRLVLSNVSADALTKHPPHAPLILSSLMAHENRVTVMNFLVQKSTVTCEDTVKSKDPLDIMCGFRRIVNTRPVFSQHNINSDKHKFERFLQPGRFTCASAYFPVSYGQAPTLIMKTMRNGTKQLVASG